jgi:hypothetical protein
MLHKQPDRLGSVAIGLGLAVVQPSCDVSAFIAHGVTTAPGAMSPDSSSCSGASVAGGRTRA